MPAGRRGGARRVRSGVPAGEGGVRGLARAGSSWPVRGRGRGAAGTGARPGGEPRGRVRRAPARPPLHRPLRRSSSGNLPLGRHPVFEDPQAAALYFVLRLTSGAYPAFPHLRWPFLSHPRTPQAQPVLYSFLSPTPHIQSPSFPVQGKQVLFWVPRLVTKAASIPVSPAFLKFPVRTSS